MAVEYIKFNGMIFVYLSGLKQIKNLYKVVILNSYEVKRLC